VRQGVRSELTPRELDEEGRDERKEGTTNTRGCEGRRMRVMIEKLLMIGGNKTQRRSKRKEQNRKRSKPEKEKNRKGKKTATGTESERKIKGAI